MSKPPQSNESSATPRPNGWVDVEKEAWKIADNTNFSDWAKVKLKADILVLIAWVGDENQATIEKQKNVIQGLAMWIKRALIERENGDLMTGDTHEMLTRLVAEIPKELL